MNFLNRITAAVVLMLILSSCASTGATKEDGKEQDKDSRPLHKAATPAIAIMAESCPITGTAGQTESLIALAGAALVQAFAPAVIGFGYDLVVKALDERADDLSASTSATARGTLYRERAADTQDPLFAPKPRCLIFIRGGFDQATGDKPPVLPDWSDVARLRVDDALKKAGLQTRITHQPEVYAEFALSYPTKIASKTQPVKGQDGKPLKNSKGGEVSLNEDLNVPVGLSIRPVKVLYGKSGAKRNPDPQKQLVFQVDLKAKTLKESKWEDTTLVEALFDLGMVSIGSSVAPNLLESKAPVSGTLVPPAEIPVGVLIEHKDANGKVSRDHGEVLALDLVDITANISLTETQDGGDFERLLSKTAKEKKDSVLKPLLDAIAGVGKDKSKSGGK